MTAMEKSMLCPHAAHPPPPQQSPRIVPRVQKGASRLSPLRSGEGYDLIRVLHIDRRRLDELTREAIKEMLFDEWSAVQQRQATIRWFWGEAERAAGNKETDHVH